MKVILLFLITLCPVYKSSPLLAAPVEAGISSGLVQASGRISLSAP